MIDHCSISWSIDECCSVLGNKTSTVQWCLVSQSLQDAGHSKGSHGYGGNWGGSGASFHHNLMCHHESRVPRLGPRPTTQMDERMDMRNNVLYNWGGNGCYGGENMNVNIVNNYYKPGPATAQRSTTIQRRIAGIGIRTTEYVTNSPDYAPALHKWGKFFVDGNVNSKYSDVTNDNWTYGIYNQISSSDNDGLYTQTTKDTMKLSAPIAFIHTTTHDAATAYTKVLKYAGCCINRDWIDTLMIHDTTYGVATYTGTSGKFTGDATNHPGIIDSQYDNKPADAAADWSPWPTLSSTTAPTDTDVTATYELSQATNSTNTSSEYTFNNGFSITNTKGKGYATGSNNGIKYSSGTQYTIVIPTNFTVTAVEFIGYDNYADVDAYLGELGGVTYTSTQYVFPQKDASGTTTTKDYNVTLTNPATGTLTFTPQGKQVVWKIILTVTTSTGIKKIYTVDASSKNIYTTDGRLIKNNATDSDINSLSKGIYIIGNKTRIVK
jgi:hypothetical protein